MIFTYNRKSLFERANYSQTLVKLAPPPSLDRRSSDECCSAAVTWREKECIRNERGGAEEKLRWAHKQKSDKAGDSLQFTREPTSHESCSDPEWSDTTYGGKDRTVPRRAPRAIPGIPRFEVECHEPRRNRLVRRIPALGGVRESGADAGGRFAVVEEERVPRSPNSERGEK